MSRYSYPARFDRVVDGDTIDFILDRGFNTVSAMRCRLLGLDTPEVRHSDPRHRDAGLAVKKYVERWLWAAESLRADAEEWPLQISTRVRSKYGEPLARVVRLTDGAELGADLLALGYAQVYLGRTKTRWQVERLVAISDELV